MGSGTYLLHLKRPQHPRSSEAGTGPRSVTATWRVGRRASVSGVVVTSYPIDDGGMIQHWVQGKGGGVSQQHAFPGDLLRHQDNSSRLSCCNLLQGGGGGPGGSTEKLVSLAGYINP
ncbi:hypothetical protein GWK47_051733 [Chionoecetes opilio]|uniref:Uncharacterized protein n=1 Tax=Chionoecetes opilio TaxID=41210 RepID=A0A8J5CS72_CHIOP|nr:hypothetical protein GWK47_051733 [Chionoecetes opilio]